MVCVSITCQYCVKIVEQIQLIFGTVAVPWPILYNVREFRNLQKRELHCETFLLILDFKPTVLTITQHICSMKNKSTKYTQINTTKSRLRTVICTQCKKNPIQRTVRTAHLSVLMIVHNCRIQYNTEQF